MEKIKEIADYCRRHIEDYDERVSIALTRIDHMRCPLWNADPNLAYEIERCACDWAEDNKVELAEDFDAEKVVLWAE